MAGSEGCIAVGIHRYFSIYFPVFVKAIGDVKGWDITASNLTDEGIVEVYSTPGAYLVVKLQVPSLSG